MRRPFWRLDLPPSGLAGPGLLAGCLAASLGVSVPLSGAAPGGIAPPFSGAAALRVIAAAPRLMPGLAPALLMAATAAAAAAPKGCSDAVAGMRSGGTVAAGWAEATGADAEAARTGRASAAGVSAARGVCAADPPGKRAVRASRLLYTLPELGRDSFPLSSLGFRLCPAPAARVKLRVNFCMRPHYSSLCYLRSNRSIIVEAPKAHTATEVVAQPMQDAFC